MQIDKRLNLVVPVYQDGDKVLYVHSAPIRRETFERYFFVISKAFATIYQKGLGAMAGPRIAAMLLKKIAQEDGEWEGPLGVERGLFAEIHRLSNVIAPGDKGWEQIPFEEALRLKLIDDDDASEIENAICFFILASAMHRKTELTGVLEAVKGLWGAQTTSFNSTEYIASLPTLIPVESSGEKATPSSIPS